MNAQALEAACSKSSSSDLSLTESERKLVELDYLEEKIKSMIVDKAKLSKLDVTNPATLKK